MFWQNVEIAQARKRWFGDEFYSTRQLVTSLTKCCKTRHYIYIYMRSRKDHSPSLAISSRIGGIFGSVPISKSTRPVAARVAQNSNPPLPFPIRVSFPCQKLEKKSTNLDLEPLTLTLTGTSGKTRTQILACLKGFNFRLRTSRAVISCCAVSRRPFPLIRIPKSPNVKVVPLVDPPIGMGTFPLCRFMYCIFLGARTVRLRDWPFRNNGESVSAGRGGASNKRKNDIIDTGQSEFQLHPLLVQWARNVRMRAMTLLHLKNSKGMLLVKSF